MTHTSKHAQRTIGEALNDPNTALGRAAVQLAADRAQRLAAAQALVAAEGITLEEAFARIWKVK